MRQMETVRSLTHSSTYLQPTYLRRTNALKHTIDTGLGNGNEEVTL